MPNVDSKHLSMIL